MTTTHYGHEARHLWGNPTQGRDERYRPCPQSHAETYLDDLNLPCCRRCGAIKPNELTPTQTRQLAKILDYENHHQ